MGLDIWLISYVVLVFLVGWTGVTVLGHIGCSSLCRFRPCWFVALVLKMD